MNRTAHLRGRSLTTFPPLQGGDQRRQWRRPAQVQPGQRQALDSLLIAEKEPPLASNLRRSSRTTPALSLCIQWGGAAVRYGRRPNDEGWHRGRGRPRIHDGVLPPHRCSLPRAHGRRQLSAGPDQQHRPNENRRMCRIDQRDSTVLAERPCPFELTSVDAREVRYRLPACLSHPGSHPPRAFSRRSSESGRRRSAPNPINARP